MHCVFCRVKDSKVTNSRTSKDGGSIRRRRQCRSCGRRFTTYERIEITPVIVIKRDLSREMFNKKKILKGLLRACEKRPIPIIVLENLVYELERYLHDTNLEREISSAQIGELVLGKLKDIDEVAYIRFASVYRKFSSMSSFLNELQSLK